MQRDIRHQFTFLQSPEAIWEYLTVPELMAQWLMTPHNFQPVVGQKFQFKTKPIPKFGFDGNVYCEVLEVQPYKKLSYSWKGGSLDSVVVWTLEPTADGTMLTLEHKGFKGIKNFMSYIIMNRGWIKIVKRLLKILKYLKRSI
jgi:uncharacterized protein YndB with AHSA1/START domain